MQPWAILQFALVLAFVIGGIALIIGELHMIARAEKREWWRQFKEKVTAIR